ncbi:VOC family protein [Streptomyces sp. NPDC048248]|uniref:VOC family protein n=1 Tax=Streptomyces sp. NPDC048248 TaxID=3365523 RepID=UPI0037249DC5
MSVSLRSVVIESQDPVALGAFWSAALESSIDPGMGGVNIRFGRNQELLLYIVEGSGEKNRKVEPFMHLAAETSTLDEEAARLMNLGAVTLKRQWNVHTDLNVGWIIMSDPEGNCFQLLSSDEEVAAAERMLESWE